MSITELSPIKLKMVSRSTIQKNFTKRPTQVKSAKGMVRWSRWYRIQSPRAPWSAGDSPERLWDKVIPQYYTAYPVLRLTQRNWQHFKMARKSNRRFQSTKKESRTENCLDSRKRESSDSLADDKWLFSANRGWTYQFFISLTPPLCAVELFLKDYVRKKVTRKNVFIAMTWDFAPKEYLSSVPFNDVCLCHKTTIIPFEASNTPILLLQEFRQSCLSCCYQTLRKAMEQICPW